MITKIFALIVIAWFYKTAAKLGENQIQWAIIGLIGYCIFVGLTYVLVSKPLLDLFLNQTMWLSMALGHLPAITGIVSTWFIRKRLISMANTTTNARQD